MFADILENIIGGGSGGMSIFGEAREALLGGCWGVLMSGFFLFAFFFTLLALLFGIEGFTLQVEWIASPLVALLCVSAMLSPVIGALFGAQSGVYSITRHIGCFALYLIVLIGLIFALPLIF